METAATARTGAAAPLVTITEVSRRGRTAKPATGPTPRAPRAPRSKGAKPRLPVRIATWIVMGALTLVVLGLLAVTVGPRFLPYQALVVQSGSMSPTIPTGSIVFYRKIDAAKVKVGNVIVFSRPGDATERVTHRVYKIGHSSTGRFFETKGDANGTPDDWRVPAVGTGWIAAFHLPYVGYALYDLQSTLARLLLLVVPAFLLGMITLGELVSDRRRRHLA